MYRNSKLLFLYFLLSSFKLSAQTDAFAGTWQMEYATYGTSPVIFELQIALPENNVLYPAHIKLQCDSFLAEYELLLVKKSTRELGISKNKYALAEQPFGLGDWSLLLNGVFDLSKDLKGQPVLNLLRMETRPSVQPKKGMPIVKDTLNETAKRIRSFLKEADLELKKINNMPWADTIQERILEPSLSPAYFGLRDTIYLPTRDGVINFSGIKRRKNDIVSVTLNGQVVFDKMAIDKKGQESDILLSPGLNILTFFADNFGDGLPNTSRLNLEFGNKKFDLDFANPKDSAATFIVAKLVCDPDQSKARYFRENNRIGDEKTLKKNEKLIGSIISTSQHLIFAIWDEVINDGDSISIKVNGEWLTQGFPVLNAPKYISVTLKPGPNNIVFMADNLGSIPPNTSALEIIDGKRRKYYAMETKPGEKNLVKIFYDTGAEQ